MTKERLTAFSDGVLAIIITIMVLELKVPHGETIAALKPLLPVFGSYVLSFIYVAIYWNNHHHMFYVAEKVNGAVLWANIHLLFWLSLIPFSTNWVGENHFAPAPMAIYGVVLLGAGAAYWILQSAILKMQGKNSLLAHALGSDFKGKISPVIYLAAIVFSFTLPLLAGALYIGAALLWLVPDSRIENAVLQETKQPDEDGIL